MNKGFTLVELVISIGILSGIILIIGIFGLDVYDFSIFLGENITAQQELQITMRVMVSEMRSMSQSVAGAYPLDTASQTTIVFYSDIDGNGLTEKIRYFIDGNILKKGIIRPSGIPLSYNLSEEIISEQVHDLYDSGSGIFSYYNASYSGTEAPLNFPINPGSVSLIKINISVDRNPADSSSRVNFSNLVKIRNI